MNKKGILFFLLLIIHALSFAATSEDTSTILDKKVEAQNEVEQHPNIINLYRPNYALPYYYTNSPYQAIYLNATPNNQTVRKEEMSAQLSFLIPLFRHLIEKKPLALNFAYTQKMFWQVYAKSQYFRETNYEPELFIENYFNSNFAAQIGINHQSNGRGGYLERSWNRLYLQGELTGTKWSSILRVWTLVGEDISSNIHNPSIAHYLGYDNLLLAYKFGSVKASLQLQNLESGFSRGFQQVTLSYPLLNSLSVYAMVFNGYGQSLIEYDHKTTSVGIGFTLNDWVN